MQTRRWSLVLTLVVVAALGAVGAPLAGAVGWSAPVTPVAAVYDPAVAVNARGDVAVAGRTAAGTGILVATRPAGGAFEAPVPIGTGSTAQTKVAINAAGDVAVAWMGGAVAHLAVRPHGGTFGTIQDFPNANGAIDFVHVAIDDAGEVAFAWSVMEGGKYLLKDVVRAPNGTLGPVGSTAAGQSIGGVSDLAMNAAGDAIVTTTRTDGANYIAQAAVRAPGAPGFSPFVALSATGQDASYPVADIDGQGRAVVAWSRSDGSFDRIQVAFRPPGGIFTLPTEASPAGANADYAGIAIGGGEVTASWTTANQAVARIAPFGSVFGAPAAQFGSGGGRSDVAMAPDGTTVVDWGTSASGSNAVVAATRPAGGSFGAALPVATPIGTVFGNVVETPVDIDDAGDAVAAFEFGSGLGFSVLDVSAPQLRGLAVPGSGTAGSSVAGFSVAPFDSFSAVGAPHWDFGDGGTADGAGVAHTYANPGTYTVKVTATDAQGNAGSATRTIAIGAAPAASVPPAATPATTPPPIVPAPPKAPPARCKVPKLTGLSYTQAKAKLTKAHCRIGATKRPKGHRTTKHLIVRSQSRKAGTSTTGNAKVDITMKVKPAKKHRRK